VPLKSNIDGHERGTETIGGFGYCKAFEATKRKHCLTLAQTSQGDAVNACLIFRGGFGLHPPRPELQTAKTDNCHNRRTTSYGAKNSVDHHRDFSQLHFLEIETFETGWVKIDTHSPAVLKSIEATTNMSLSKTPIRADQSNEGVP